MTEPFFRVYGWMSRKFPIHSNELLVYAMIYSFTESCGQYEGSLQYLADQTGCTKVTAFRTLQRLLEKKLIVKQEVYEDGVRYCLYAACDRDGLLSERPYPADETTTPPLSECSPPAGETITPPLSECSPPAGETTTPPLSKCSSAVGETTTPPLSKCSSAVGETITNNKTDTITHNKEDKREPAPQKNRYGEYQNVLLSAEDLEKLQREFPEDWRQRVERLSSYMASTGKRYRNHLATIRNWAQQDEKDKPKSGGSPYAFLKGGHSL